MAHRVASSCFCLNSLIGDNLASMYVRVCDFESCVNHQSYFFFKIYLVRLKNVLFMNYFNLKFWNNETFWCIATLSKLVIIETTTITSYLKYYYVVCFLKLLPKSIFEPLHWTAIVGLVYIWWGQIQPFRYLGHTL